MELQDFCQIQSWTCLLFITLFLFYKYMTLNFDYWKTRGIPGDKPYLLIGTFKPAWNYQLGEVDVKCVHKYGKTWGGFDGRQPVLFTTDPEIIQQVTVKDFSIFTNRRRFTLLEKMRYAKEMLTVLRDDKWKVTRTILTPAFTSGKLKHMVCFIEDCVGELIQSLETKVAKEDSVEMTDELTYLTLNVIASCAFGMKINCFENPTSDFVANCKKAFRANPKQSYLMLILPKLFDLLPTQLLPNFFDGNFAEMANRAIDMRSKNKQINKKDFLDMLIAAEDSSINGVDSKNNNGLTESKKSLSKDSVVAHIILFLLAGHETTAASLCFLTLELAMNSKVQEKLITEIDQVMTDCKGKLSYEIVSKMQYLEMVVSEVLRMHPPGIRTERCCKQDRYSVKGIEINKDDIVLIPIYALHHNPELYPDPEVFDPERFSPENKAKRNICAYIPFGSGPRNCIGVRFAVLEIKITIVLLLSKFRLQTWEKTEFPIKCRGGFSLRSPVSINLKLHKRTDQPSW